MGNGEIRRFPGPRADDGGRGDAAVGAEARRAFPDALLPRWLRQCRMLAEAGLGEGVTLAYTRHGPAIAEAVGPEFALALAEEVKDLAYAAGRQAARALPPATAQAAARLAGPAEVRAWLAMLRRFAPEMPESVAPLLDHTARLLGRLDLEGYEAWVLGGLRASGGDRERRRAFFGFVDPAAERALLREAGEVVFGDLERPLKTFLTALWNLRVVTREAGVVAGRAIPRRTSFDGAILRVPATFPGVPAARARTLFRASLAHVGAHLAYSGRRFPRGTLKPLQIALVGLIEDARVEHLAMRDFPGLRRLWLPFHEARPEGAVSAPVLLARLSRALIDPEHDDPDPWVRKGREMFFGRAAEWDDPLLSRGIGNLLGNDLGQMRIQFNARTYVVEPPYRDDNLGLWDFGDEAPESPEHAEVLESVRIAPQETNEPAADPDQSDAFPEDEPNRARPAEDASHEEGVPVAQYPEWDYVIGRERGAWTTVVEYPAPPGSPARIDEVLERRPEVVNRITALVRAARVSRPVRVRRRLEGERLDIDACIEAAISRRRGESPDPRVYMTSAHRSRDLSVLLLLDVSQSTNDPVRGARTRVIDLEREATALLAHAMDALGDPFAIHAFCSNGREEVRYIRAKDFDAPYDAHAKSVLAGLSGGLSTRIGAAMRHAAQDLRRQRTHRRLLLVVTDGEPSDIDVKDRRYLVEDARKAVAGLRHDGIDVFCVGLDSGGDSYLTRIFGRYNALQIDRLERLPEKLPMLYFRLTS